MIKLLITRQNANNRVHYSAISALWMDHILRSFCELIMEWKAALDDVNGYNYVVKSYKSLLLTVNLRYFKTLFMNSFYQIQVLKLKL